MKFSLLIASGVIAIVAIVGASASRSPYHSNACGYDCRNALTYNSHYQQPGAESPYGPYHSYAVRPAVYGGYGMYHYKGYARHPLPPPNAHYRKVRNYATGSAPSSHYGLRPVKALVLAPAYSGNGYGTYKSNHGPAYRQQHYTKSYPKAYGHPQTTGYAGPARHYPTTGYQSQEQQHYTKSYPKAYGHPQTTGYAGPARHYPTTGYQSQEQQHYDDNNAGHYKQMHNGPKNYKASTGGY